MEIKKDYDLSNLNTFGIKAYAKRFVEMGSMAEMKELFESHYFSEQERIFLGGGSNVLFTKDFNGLVVLNKLKGIDIIHEDSSSVTVRAMGGEIWHDLVIFSVEHEYWGIENLSLIPGTVGAAPIQNIGAYGAELKDVLISIEAYDLKDGTLRIFTKEECEPGYRYSIFKNKLKGKYFIAAVNIKLSKIEKKNISYKILREYLEQNDIKINGPKDISDAVASIRRSKLPDPAKIGNAGSFFKNILLSESEGKKKLEELQRKYPDIPYFKEDGYIKIPSAWLIEASGWKGKRAGNAGVHDKQALVLINHGEATGEEIKNLSDQIIKSVFSKFGLTLVPEVNLI